MLKKIIHFIKLIRPLNVFIAFISLWVAAFISPQFQCSTQVLIASLTVALIAAGGNIINDIFDLEIDKINKPHRVLARGALSIQQARWFFTLTYAAGLVFAAICGSVFLLIAGLTAFLLYAYSAFFKRTILLGNLLVSFTSALVFVYGALAVDDLKAGFFPALFVFFFHFGREVLKDMQDVEGDLAQNAVTFPGRFGPRFSVLLINFIFLLLTLLTILPYILSIYNKYYLITVVSGVDLVLIFSSALLWFRRDVRTLGFLSLLLKMDMFIGLAAVIIGSRYVVFFN